MSLITVQNVKDMIWDPGSTQPTNFDIMLQDLIDDITVEMEDEIEMKLTAVAANVVYQNYDQKYLWLEHMNVSNVSIWIDPTKAFAPGYLVDPQYYTVHSLRGYIERHRPTKTQMRERMETPLDFWSGDWWGMDFAVLLIGIGVTDKQNTLKIQYDGGFTSANFDRALKRAMIRQVVYEFRRRKDLGLSSVQYPDGSVNKFSDDAWLPKVKDVLDKHRRLTL